MEQTCETFLTTCINIFYVIFCFPGQVTYRVVQVAPQDGGEPQQVITHNPFQSAAPGAHVAQVSCH